MNVYQVMGSAWEKNVVVNEVFVDILRRLVVMWVTPLEVNARGGGLSTVEKIYNVCGILVDIPVIYGTPAWGTTPRIWCHVNNQYYVMRMNMF
tara:strand:- start:906 stop:1184 length:279 start_codon:yes stop_codon:yes gene_type:complete